MATDVAEVNAETGEVIERAFTAQEAAQAVIDADHATAQTAAGALRAANTSTLHAQAEAALAQNRAAIAATAPTNAQVIAQVKNLSAQNNALIRLVLGLLDATD